MTRIDRAALPAGFGRREPGDLYIIANDVIEPVDFRAGIKGNGRILHCAPDFTVKGSVRLEEEGTLVGLALDPVSGVLYATSPQRHEIFRFDEAGERLRPPSYIPVRRWGNLVFDPAGRGLVGVHSIHGGPVPEDGFGDGKLARFDPRRREIELHDVEIDGGRGGKHCISSLALDPAGEILFYGSESGRRLLRYAVEARRQLPDFLRFDDDADEGTYGLSVLADGSVLLALGTSAALFDPQGKRIRDYDTGEGRGWTRARAALDPDHFYLGNFLEGRLERRLLATGEVLATLEVGAKGSLLSAIEVPAP